MAIQHVIIGGGPAATNAAETIRQFDDGGSRIVMICDEPAHSRMALPYWLAGRIPREHTYTGDPNYFQRLNVETRFDVRVTQVDPQTKTVALNDGSEIGFDNLLIATGSTPLRPAIDGTDLPGVQPLWSLADTERVLQTVDGIAQPRVVLVGAGFIGFIMLNAMFKRGWRLTVVERQSQVLPRMLDETGGQFIQRWLDARGVAVHTGATVQAIEAGDGDAKRVRLADGTSIDADAVVLAIGIRPNLELVDGSGIETEMGILVNDRMQTNFPFIYAGGDVAQGPCLYSEHKLIHAIQPTAVDHGRVAGANMAGHEVHYPGSLLMNVVDVCGLQAASFGNWSDPEAEAMTIANESGHVYRKLLWNGDQITGAIFIGRPNDLGMLTDVGMVKGILQTGTAMGPWKDFLHENPFDIRRAYVATGVAQKLVKTTLLGRPTRTRQFQHGGAKPVLPPSTFHDVYVGTKGG